MGKEVIFLVLLFSVGFACAGGSHSANDVFYSISSYNNLGDAISAGLFNDSAVPTIGAYSSLIELGHNASEIWVSVEGVVDRLDVIGSLCSSVVSGVYDIANGEVGHTGYEIMIGDESLQGMIDRGDFCSSFIRIGNCTELQKIGNDYLNYPWDGNYVLLRDIDCSATNPYDLDNVGSPWDYTDSLSYGYNGGSRDKAKGFAPISMTGAAGRVFVGTFDGAGYEIRNLYINRGVRDRFIGLFGYVSNGGVPPAIEIRNVGLIDVNISGMGSVGGLIGSYVGSHSLDDYILNSYVTGEVSAQGLVGGVIGFVSEANITNISFIGNVSGTGTYTGGLIGKTQNDANLYNSSFIGNVNGFENVGGVVGYCTNSPNIINSYAIGSVSGTGKNIGGLVGWGSPYINGSFFRGEVAGGNYQNVGGLIGYGTSSRVSDSYFVGSVGANVKFVAGLVGRGDLAKITNSFSSATINGNGVNEGGIAGLTQNVIRSYWNKDLYVLDNGKGIGLATSKMLDQSNYVGWDFTDIWAIQPGSYPCHQWWIDQGGQCSMP